MQMGTTVLVGAYSLTRVTSVWRSRPRRLQAPHRARHQVRPPTPLPTRPLTLRRRLPPTLLPAPLPTLLPALPTTPPPILAMMALMAAIRTAAAFATRQVITSGFVHALRATTARAAVCSLTQGTSALPSRQHRRHTRRPHLLLHLPPSRPLPRRHHPLLLHKSSFQPSCPITRHAHVPASLHLSIASLPCLSISSTSTMVRFA